MDALKHYEHSQFIAGFGRFEDLRSEEAKLKRTYAKLAIDDAALKDVVVKSSDAFGAAVSYLIHAHQLYTSKARDHIDLNISA